MDGFYLHILEFQYSPDGHRVLKVVIPKEANAFKLYTYYVRDAQGNIMATYERSFKKIIDYDSIRYKGINDTIKKVAGFSAFGEYMSYLYGSNSAFSDSIFSDAIDSGYVGVILTHYDLVQYINDNVENRIDSVIDNYDGTALVDAIYSHLISGNDLQNFLQYFCDNVQDLTNYLMTNYLSDYLWGLYYQDAGQFDVMFTNLGGSTEGNIEDDIAWIVSNKTWSNVKTYLNGNWPNYNNDCTTHMAIIMQISSEAREAALKDAFTYNIANFKTAVKAYFDKGTLYELLYSYDMATLQSTILISFDNSTMLSWYYSNNSQMFVQYAAMELHTRPAQWQQLYATNTMEEYFTYLKDYFGQVTYDNILLKYYNVSRAYLDSFTLSEWHIYGSSRLGVYTTNKNLVTVKFYGDANGSEVNYTDTVSYSIASSSSCNFILERGSKKYELSSHLGNVLTVISDKKISVCTNDTVRYYTAEILQANDYSCFGAPMPSRTYTASSTKSYRFAFNGQEKDDETYGDGNEYDFGERTYNSRLGVWLSLDPLMKKFPNESHYSYCSGNPIFYTDKEGKQKITYIETIHENGAKTYVKIVDENKVKPLRVMTSLFGIPTHDYNYVNYDLVQFIRVDEKTGKIEQSSEILTNPTKNWVEKAFESFKGKEGLKENGIPMTASEEFNSAESQYNADSKYKEAPINVEALMMLRGGAVLGTEITITGAVTQGKAALIKIEKMKGALGGFDVGKGGVDLTNAIGEALRSKYVAAKSDSCPTCHLVTGKDEMLTQKEGGSHLSKMQTKTIQKQTTKH